MERDFDPWGGQLDGQTAWRNFGELTIEGAFELFCTSPIIYVEDFMFMGPRAFTHYFPVIDRYVREVAPEDGETEIEVSGLDG